MIDTFYYPIIKKGTLPNDCFTTYDAAYDRALDMLKMEHGYDLYALYEPDIKIHKITLNV